MIKLLNIILNFKLTDFLIKKPSKKIKQSISLLSATVGSLIVGMLISVINTRVLGPENYGTFKYIESFYALIFTFTSFGLFTSSRNYIAKINKSEENYFIGLMLLISISILILTSLVSIIFILSMNKIQANFPFHATILSIPILITFYFRASLENILQGSNRINYLSVIKIIPGILFLFIAIFLLTKGTVGVLTVVYIRFGTLLIVQVYIWMRLKPIIKNTRKHLNGLFKENKTYGFHIYISSLIILSIGHIQKLILGYTSDMYSDIGFYSLAITITTPLIFFPEILSSVNYKDFVHSKKISIKLQVYTILLSLTVGIVFFFLLKFIINIIYGVEYNSVVFLSKILTPAIMLNGLSLFYNRFIGSQGKGVALKSINITIGFITLFLSIIFIYYFDAKGAAIATLLSSILNFILILKLYIKLTKYE